MSSRLAYIDVPENCNPINLLKTWIEQYKSQTKSKIVTFNLATSFLNGDVSNRFIVLKELTQDGVIFNTNSNSLKVKQITENPMVSANFLLTYVNGETKSTVNQQIRLKGVAEQLPHNVSERMFETQPLFAKIRAMLVQEQGVKISWDELKKKHDCLVEGVQSGKVDLKAPEQLVLYKIVPNKFDFYQAGDGEIADRILFEINENKQWEHYHITP
ncbi:hypothetical protein GWI33_003610 [Rhynchophorus ferrugineus]|uniref:pyridoxal 5'-phosphate synthase n=1 Tax=Rhynchophorus ferrugineus TaxID=354439 RepID=A0A834M2W4_RHYFE|nr:hypothetical protein GWI33_003616 [Rhynchophorus ferrugineus]KAF7263105.1 hypothetical protein GWI33_003610 [Rhynchophorus ferrugineus]